MDAKCTCNSYAQTCGGCFERYRQLASDLGLEKAYKYAYAGVTAGAAHALSRAKIAGGDLSLIDAMERSR